MSTGWSERSETRVPMRGLISGFLTVKSSPAHERPYGGWGDLSRGVYGRVAALYVMPWGTRERGAIAVYVVWSHEELED